MLKLFDTANALLIYIIGTLLLIAVIIGNGYYMTHSSKFVAVCSDVNREFMTFEFDDHALECIKAAGEVFVTTISPSDSTNHKDTLSPICPYCGSKDIFSYVYCYGDMPIDYTPGERTELAASNYELNNVAICGNCMRLYFITNKQIDYYTTEKFQEEKP